MTSLDLIERAKAKMAEYAVSATEANRFLAMSDRETLRRFIIWCHELGDSGIHECLKRLFNHGYRGRELDLAWRGQ
jgi:hypothetical protein